MRLLAAAVVRLLGRYLEDEMKNMTTIRFGGMSMPAGDIEAMVKELPKIAEAIKAGKDSQSILELIEPAAMPAIEAVANFLFPGAGTGIEVIAGVVEFAGKHAHPATPEEEARMFDKAQGTPW